MLLSVCYGFVLTKAFILFTGMNFFVSYTAAICLFFIRGFAFMKSVAIKQYE